MSAKDSVGDKLVASIQKTKAEASGPDDSAGKQAPVKAPATATGKKAAAGKAKAQPRKTSAKKAAPKKKTAAKPAAAKPAS